MTPELLERLLRVETARVEWKLSDRDDAEILPAVCALANELEASGEPGYVVLGVARDGRVAGLGYSGAALDQAQQSLSSKLSSTKLLPHPSVSIEPIEARGALLLVLAIQPYPVPPVVKVGGVPWVRSGTTTRRASEADLARLQERRPDAALPFDLRPLTAAGLDDLDLERLARLRVAEVEAAGDPESFPDFERWLGQRDLARRVGAVWRPTAAALLLHGLSPQTHFPGAVVEFARYSGCDFDAPVGLRKTVSGALGDQLDALWKLFEGLIVSTPSGQDGVRTPYAPEYPLEAIRELIRNLVQHRQYDATNAPGRIAWFDDRIVFSNPGGPYGQASQGRFGDHSDYRNPTVTRGLAELGYVERLGRGIRRVERLLASAGHPPLDVKTDGYTSVTLRGRA